MIVPSLASGGSILLAAPVATFLSVSNSLAVLGNPFSSMIVFNADADLGNNCSDGPLIFNPSLDSFDCKPSANRSNTTPRN